jgi:hypothetical protein
VLGIEVERDEVQLEREWEEARLLFCLVDDMNIHILCVCIYNV